MNIPIICEKCRCDVEVYMERGGIFVVKPCECKGEEQDDSDSFAYSPDENGIGPDENERTAMMKVRVGWNR